MILFFVALVLVAVWLIRRRRRVLNSVTNRRELPVGTERNRRDLTGGIGRERL